eukprot:2749196-Prymnesium_polylepis.1
MGLHRHTAQVIAVASDHGYRLGEQLSWGKGRAVESALRIPLFIKAPSLSHRHGTVVSAPTEGLISLMPTLAELAGLHHSALPADIRGQSLLPQMLDDTLATLGSGCAVRSDTNEASSI